MAVKEGWKAKQWYNLVSPDMLGKTNIGETVADEPEKLIGRVIETTLGEITNDYSKQNIKLSLKVDSVGGDSAYTKFVGHQLTNDYLRSLVKRHSSTIDTNLTVTTKDGYKLRVKPSCYTIKRARANQIKSIRQIMNKVVAAKAKEMDMVQFIQDAVTGKIAASIYHDVKPVYPLRRVEVRKTKVEAEPAVSEPVAS